MITNQDYYDVKKKEYGKEWDESHTGTRSTPLVIKDKLYIMSAYGRLTCMNSSNGQTIWSIDFMEQHDAKNLTWGITENLVYDGNAPCALSPEPCALRS